MVAVQSGATSAPNSTSKNSSHSIPSSSNSSQFSAPSTNSTLAECGIVDVWSHNLEGEFRKIRKIIQKYPFVAMVFIHLEFIFLRIYSSFLLIII